MEIYITPTGQTAFQHDDPINDGRFTPSAYYYVTWVDLPANYFT
jgi:hypothetical protein